MPKVTTTYLEMRSPGELRPSRLAGNSLSFREVTPPQGAVNRFFYLSVGAPWSWNDKRDWSSEQWQTYAESPGMRTFAAYSDSLAAGYYELRRDRESGVEIAYFGLLPGFIGRGFGGALLTRALEEAWQMGAARVWVHTCTDDHPAALANYLARGMRIYKVEPPSGQTG